MTTDPVPPITRPRFPALDGVRAIAAFAVLATHVGFASGRSIDNGPFAPLLSRLDFGVTLFFLLSGFVIYRPFVVASLTALPAPRTRRFYIRRAARILPGYWLAVLVTLGWLSLERHDGPTWASYLTMAQTYNGHNVDPSLTQMWTLSVELSFYLLVPLFAALVGRHGGRDAVLRRQLVLLAGLVAVAVAANLLGNLGSRPGRDSLLWLPANLDWFALGMLLALVSVAGPTGLPRWLGTLPDLARAGGSCWLLAGLLFWFATLPVAGTRLLLVLGGWEWSIKHYLYGLCALLILLPLTLAPGGRLGGFLRWRPMHDLGVISYGVYLWHLPLLLVIQHRLGYRTFGGHFWVLLAATAVTAVLAATLSWHLVEKPVMRWAHRFYSATPPSSRTADASATSATSTRP